LKLRTGRRAPPPTRPRSSSNSKKKGEIGAEEHELGEVGDEEHELLDGETAEGSGADTDPSGERRRTPSEQVTHQVVCHLGLEALGMN
jgi:hypothetical protein